MHCLRQVIHPMDGHWFGLDSMNAKITKYPDVHPTESYAARTLLVTVAELQQFGSWLKDAEKTFSPKGASDRGAKVAVGDKFDVALLQNELVETLKHYQAFLTGEADDSF